MKYFDAIYCINLRDRNDKFEYSKKIFEKLNLDVKFFRPKKHPVSGRIGCFESHIHVIKECYEKNMKRILIFEDDIINSPRYSESAIEEFMGFLKNNAWCQYFQLGYTILPHELFSYFSSKNLHGNKVVKYNGNCTHAYVLNRDGMEKVLRGWKNAAYEKELDLDIYYKEIFIDNGASTCPILFDQNFCIENDNDKPTTLYYVFMRNLSCMQYNYSFLYWVSVLRHYMNIILLVVCFIIFFFFFHKTLVKNGKRSFARNLYR
jgi:GR25 family glycosyltransferase involved in LPS biosynthesis